MAYAVGLTATDGSLSKTGRSVVFTSGDRELVVTYLDCVGRRAKIGVQRTKRGGFVHRAQVGDVVLYRWFQSLGLTPRKSLTIGALDVPDEFFFDFTRGHLDGDGSIINGFYRGTGKANHARRYETLQTKFVSGSRKHLEWLQQRLGVLLSIRGFIQRSGGDTSWGDNGHALVYNKRASIVLLSRLYANRSAPCLQRKRDVWDDFCRRNGLMNGHAQRR